MSSIKSALLTSASHLSKILMGFVLLKLIALYLGPEGMGAVGHFMSVATIMSLVAGGGIVNAVIKYVAEYKDRPRLLLRFILASSSYSFYVSSVTFCLLVFFSGRLAEYVFNDISFYWLIILLAFMQFIFSFINIVAGVTNGLKETAIFSKIQIIGSVLALPLAWYMIANYEIVGAAISIVSIYAMSFFPAMYFFKKSIFWKRIKFVALHGFEVKKLASFTIMLLVSAITFPIVEIIIREILIKSSGYESAGIWQGSIKLASAYLGFFSVFLAYYFMPTISAEFDKTIIGKKTFSLMLMIMSLFLFGASVLYVWRGFFIPMIFSEDFKALEDVIVYQLIGDFFKISSYVIGFVGVAKGAMRLYISAEVLQNILFLSFMALMMNLYSGIEAVMMGYAIAYFFYFCIVLVVFMFFLTIKPGQD